MNRWHSTEWIIFFFVCLQPPTCYNLRQSLTCSNNRKWQSEPAMIRIDSSDLRSSSKFCSFLLLHLVFVIYLDWNACKCTLNWSIGPRKRIEWTARPLSNGGWYDWLVHISQGASTDSQRKKEIFECCASDHVHKMKFLWINIKMDLKRDFQITFSVNKCNYIYFVSTDVDEIQNSQRFPHQQMLELHRLRFLIKRETHQQCSIFNRMNKDILIAFSATYNKNLLSYYSYSRLNFSLATE